VRTVRLIIEYDGTDFHGWQVQPIVRTVQGELENAALRMLGTKTHIGSASRTDAGVHARWQVARLDTSSTIEAKQIAKGLTALTGYDVSVVAAFEADPAFNPRRDARDKTYKYSIFNATHRSPLRRRTSWHIRKPLDLAAMNEACSHLVGKWDFAAFRASLCDAPTTVRDIRSLEVTSDGSDVTLTVTATAFLQHMVRIITGTLVEVGRGRCHPDRIKTIRDSLDRTTAGRTAPAHGLCLEHISF